MTVSEVPLPPGRVGPVHHHAGFVLAYVLEGNVVTNISGEPETVYKRREMFMNRLAARMRFPGMQAPLNQLGFWR